MKNPAWKVGLFALAIATIPSVATRAQGSDTARVVLAAQLPNADPCNMTVGAIGWVIRQNVAETLTVLDPATSQVMPRLATAWQDRGDGVWRVTLRPGVRFHDGAAMDAAAVMKGIERLQNPRLTCLDRTKIRNVTFSATAVDANTVDIKADPPQVLMPVLLSFIAVPSPNMSSTEVSRMPVGTGPYVFRRWDSTNTITLERFDNYWGEKPALRNVTYLLRPDSALRASMVQIGEADVALDIAPQDATDPKADIAFFNGEVTSIRMVMKPPFDDVRVRRALNLAFNRQALIGTVLSSEATLATQQILPRVNGYDPSLQPPAYDPAEAKRLLAAARKDGVPVDREIRLVARTGQYANQEEVLQTMVQDWAAVGLKVRLQMMESAEYLKLLNKPYGDGRGAMLITGSHDNNNGDAAFTMYFRYHSQGQQSEISVPQVDRLIEQADSASGQQRTDLYRQANRLLATEIVPIVPMYNMVSYLRVGPRLELRNRNVVSGQLEMANFALRPGG